jgi:hypothetical protein
MNYLSESDAMEELAATRRRGRPRKDAEVEVPAAVVVMPDADDSISDNTIPGDTGTGAPPRTPYPGAWVYYWMPGDLANPGTMRPIPAMLTTPGRREGCWNLNRHMQGFLRGSINIPFSEVPKLGHWTWGLE